MVPKIRCPYCGAEYVPSEIFMPEDMLDTMYIVDKDKNGIIEHVEGEEAELKESYICDYCNKEFIVTANISYESKTSYVEEEYVTRL